jgi:hypothetical protein
MSDEIPNPDTETKKSISLGDSINVLTEITETKDLIISYVKQETLGPILALKRKIIFGVVGALCYGFGLLMVSVGLLRFMQGEFHVFHGNLNFLPYMIDFFATLILAIIFGMIAISKAIKSKG